jgi:subtilisin family serine protease
MRYGRYLIPAGLAAVLAAALPGSAAAITCSYPAGTYAKEATGVGPAGGPTTNDPFARAQWGLSQIKAPGAWARGARGAGVTIAVLDTGLDLAHPDLQGKPLAGTDYVKEGDACPGPQDENGHGTHVAGIAAANTGNGIGTAGVAPDAKILPVRVLDARGTEAELGVVYEGIRWAADNGAHVINLSLADLPLTATLDGTDDDAEAVVNYAWSKGAVVVAAASNEAFPLCNYPAAASRAVCVGATDSRGAPAAYSNFPNSPSNGVGVRAPGGEGSPILCEYDGDIWSTTWPGDEIDSECGDLKGYETFAGSSMAAPHVSGVAALLLGRGLTNAQVVQCLKTTSSNNGGYDPAFGYGIVNADAAVARCSPTSTPTYQPPPPGGGGGGPPPGDPPPGGGGQGDPGAGSGEAQVRVTVKRTTRARLAKSGRLSVTVRSDRAASVKLRAVLTRGKTKSTAGTRTVALGGAGSRTAGVRLSKSARRRLASSSKYRLVLRWRSGSQTGSATASR